MSTSNEYNGKNDSSNKDVLRMQEVMDKNFTAYSYRPSELRALKDYRARPFQVILPNGNRWTESLQPIQIIQSVISGLQRPSVSYTAEGMDPIIAQMARDGVATVKEEGGFNAVLTDKPSMYREATSYGDSFCRIGLSPNSDFPVAFDNIVPDRVYVDTNATVMHSKNSSRSVTRMVVTYSYDKDQADALYPGKKFSTGRVTSNLSSTTQFNKTQTQDNVARETEVEIAHYFDIGGKVPLYMIVAGDSNTIIETNRGDGYPFKSSRTGKPFIPVGHFRGPIDSDEGFFNYGYLHIFYRYMISRQRLFNKQFGNSMRAMTDMKVLNTGKMKSIEVMKRIRDAKTAAAAGQQALIINDTGEQFSVSALEAGRFEAELKSLQDQLDLEIKRMGINMDAIRETVSTTAQQIISENEAQVAVKEELINKNTEFFKFIEYATMDIIREYVSPDDKTPLRTSAKQPKAKKDELGNVKMDENGLPVLEKKNGIVEEEKVEGLTLGLLKQILDEHEIFVEVDTKSGVRQKDSLKAARAVALQQMGAGNPVITKMALNDFAAAVGTSIPEGAFDQESASPTQGGINGAIDQVTGQSNLPLK